MDGLRLPPPERTLQRIVALQADRLGERPCLDVDGMSLSYADVRDAAAAFAGTLHAAGIERGDRVAIMSENRWEILQCLLGCAWMGAILVPINTASRGAQLQHILTNAGPKLVAAEADVLARVIELPRPDEVAALWRLGDGEDAGWDGLAATAFPNEA